MFALLLVVLEWRLYEMIKEVPCFIFRGGTSKGVFFLDRDIPIEGLKRDKFLLNVMGSPDVNQINGLGGGTSLTSKVAIISKAKSHEYDVNYTFAQVSIDKDIVDYKGNCGNISAAVGPYAIEMGLVKPNDGITVIRIFNTNTKKIIYSFVQTPDGKVSYEGDFSISGVPGTSAPIKLIFKNPIGAVTGRLLPTGQEIDILDIPQIGKIEVSIVDVANPLVFVRARDLGLTGKELPDEIDSSHRILKLVETIRGMAALKIGFINDLNNSAAKSPAVPKLTIVEEVSDYHCIEGKKIKTEEIDIIGRMMSMQKAHKAYALTGALCTVAAAVIPGTVVNKIFKRTINPQNLRIGHPSGIIQAGVDFRIEINGQVSIIETSCYCTARPLLKGLAYCKWSI